MEKVGFMLFLAMTMCWATLADSVSRTSVNREASEDDDDIDRRLRLLNKPAVKNIQSADGDIIDCVDMHKQPAFDHPTLKNHVIQTKPSIKLPSEDRATKKESSTPIISQTWQKSGSCPEGTIPIRRIRRQDLLRASSPNQFGKMYHPHSQDHVANSTLDEIGRKVVINGTKVSLPYTKDRDQAILLTVGYNYIGASGDINLWNPSVDLPDDFTTAQIWLLGGPGDKYESVEAGWMVNPKLYGDKQTRLFTHWTVDASVSTGCFDLTCSGFVQTSSEVALGSALGPISSEAAQYQISVGLFLDPNTSNWWLRLTNNLVLGYFPASLFSYLKRSAIMVNWGGQVYSTMVKKTPHTRTAMGSGAYSEALHGRACYINHVRIMDFSLSLKYPEWVGVYNDQVYCYNGQNHRDGYIGEPVFYFGGPGQNHFCP
ncbi:uncharacterized protein LOC115674486 [Syzygium oleosum]|uniref:uncharacterized protein LOC115674486 n=1 Tax=Syzygium oleosum TaxID=219896 RepID=UPI0011D196FC|nr:uncharacterized protein LOC115674486 [Syzygium oleosum]